MRSIQNDCFHTFNEIQVPDPYAALLPEADAMCRRYSDLWNHTRPGSDVWNINHARGALTAVCPETIALLRLCEQYRETTDGCFNILAATAKHAIQKDPNVSEALLAELAARLAQESILVIGDSVLCPPWGEIDFGSIAKGYVCDRLAAFLTEQGVPGAMLNLGGNVYALGNREDGTPWRIGIRDPWSGENELLCALELRDRSAVTSGMYERPLAFHGSSAHHIIDPRTGCPCASAFASVTVVSERSAEADALSTALTVMDRTEAETFLQKSGLDVLCVTADGELLYTENLHLIFTRDIDV